MRQREKESDSLASPFFLFLNLFPLLSFSQTHQEAWKTQLAGVSFHVISSWEGGGMDLTSTSPHWEYGRTHSLLSNMEVIELWNSGPASWPRPVGQLFFWTVYLLEWDMPWSSIQIRQMQTFILVLDNHYPWCLPAVAGWASVVVLKKVRNGTRSPSRAARKRTTTFRDPFQEWAVNLGWRLFIKPNWFFPRKSISLWIVVLTYTI